MDIAALAAYGETELRLNPIRMWRLFRVLRVLQVIGVMDRGGAETMVMNLYRAIDRSKIQFDFLVHEQREGDYDAEIRELGGRFFRLPRFSGVNAHTYRQKVHSIIAEHPEYRVVHGHIGSCAPIYLSVAKQAGAYTIAHSHAQNYGRGLERLVFKMAASPVRNIADYFMACSREAGLDRFGKAVVSGDCFSVVPNGIAVTRYKCDQASHEAAKARLGLVGRPVVCHTGRLTPVKNHAFLLDVFSRVHVHIPQAVLVCAGRGELEGQLKSRVDELGLAGSVRFLGVVDNVPEVLRAADAFVFPSVKEGLSLAVVEAQAAGLPATISTGVPDLALVSDRARRVSLDEGADAWAAIVLEDLNRAASSLRTDAVEQVRKHGFDIADTAARLSRFYTCAAAGGFAHD